MAIVVVVGYVTTTASPWLQVLQEDPRVVLMLASADIHARTYCRLVTKIYTGTALDAVQVLLGQPEPLPRCRDKN